MELVHFMVNFFREGGFFLYPLAAIFVIGVAIAIERFIYLTNETTQNRRVWGQVVPLINSGNFKQVVALSSRSKSSIATVLNLWATTMTARSRAKLASVAWKARSVAPSSALVASSSTSSVGLRSSARARAMR